MIQIYRCDLGKSRTGKEKRTHNQRSNFVSGDIACNVTSMAQALEFMGYYMVPYNNGYGLKDNGVNNIYKGTGVHPDGGTNWNAENLVNDLTITDQVEDYFYHFISTSSEAMQIFKDLSSYEYNEFIKMIQKDYPEATKLPSDKKVPYWYSDTSKYNAAVPTEIHRVFNACVNLYMQKFYYEKGINFPNKNFCEFKVLNFNGLINELKKCRPVVISVTFGTLNHVLTLVGVEIYVNIATGKETVTNLIADDTYGKFSFTPNKEGKQSYELYNIKNTKNFESTYGKDFKMNLTQFSSCWNKDNGCHIFYPPF